MMTVTKWLIFLPCDASITYSCRCLDEPLEAWVLGAALMISRTVENPCIARLMHWCQAPIRNIQTPIADTQYDENRQFVGFICFVAFFFARSDLVEYSYLFILEIQLWVFSIRGWNETKDGNNFG